MPMSFAKVDFSGLPKSSSTVRRGRDQAGGCARPADGRPFLFEGPVAIEPKVRFSRSQGWVVFSVPRRLQRNWVDSGPSRKVIVGIAGHPVRLVHDAMEPDRCSVAAELVGGHLSRHLPYSTSRLSMSSNGMVRTSAPRNA